MSQLDALRAAYVRDAIDLETFEDLVGRVVAGEFVALPTACWTPPTDAPGGVLVYRPISANYDFGRQARIDYITSRLMQSE